MINFWRWAIKRYLLCRHHREINQGLGGTNYWVCPDCGRTKLVMPK